MVETAQEDTITESYEPLDTSKAGGTAPAQPYVIEVSEASVITPVSRWVLAVLGAAFLALSLTQQSGSIEFDTKLPLILSPLTFFSQAVHLWNQNIYAGSGDAGTGFLFPMGVFFALGHLLHIPIWIVQRLWLAALLTTGTWGIVRLADALRIGKRWARVLAGLAYIAAPLVITWVSVSAALLAVVLLPWILIPLVKGSREGSPRQAAARSGIAVALIGGGTNAAVVFAMLPLAVIWLITRKPGPRRRALMGWWVVSVVLASFWWLAVTAFVGKYGYNYLPYTETSQLTTSTTSVFESLRGSSFWVDYFNLRTPLLPGPWLQVSSATVIIGMTVATALSLAGLCRRIPERLFLISSLAFGVLVISVGYAGASGGLFSHTIQHLLQVKLAAFRNVTKFAPDVALPLALGLAWMVSVPLWGTARRRVAGWAPSARVSLIVVSVVAIAAVAIGAVPYARQDLYKPGGFAAIPNYWSQVGQFLDANQGHDNTLMVPGSAFADYTWGNPIDEPLQVVAKTSVEWLAIIPLGSNGFIQMQDTVEQALDSGTPPPGFAQFLAREGVNYVVERNDLNLNLTGAPPPAQVHEVLSETPGLTQVASFGPTEPAKQVRFGSLPAYNSPSDLNLRAVQIFRVDAATSPVRTYPVSNPVVVSGDVGSLLPLSSSGVIAGRAAVIAGDPHASGVSSAPDATSAITDGNQRRLSTFGGIRYNQSYVLDKGQNLPTAVQGVPLNFNVVSGASHETVEAPIDAVSVASSTYGSSPLAINPSDGPGGAFDGDPNTSWVADYKNRSVGQWVSITFQHPVDLSTMKLTPLVGGPQQPTISQVKITTDQGSVSREIPHTGSAVQLSVPKGKSLHLRVTLTGVRPPALRPQGGIVLGAGITDISIPGVLYKERMKTPDDETHALGHSSKSPVIVLNRPIANANLSLGQSPTDDPFMAREFSIPQSMSARVTGYAVPNPGTALERLLQGMAPTPAGGLKITASSWLGDLPRFRSANLENDSGNPWIAGLHDTTPTLKLSWSQPREISQIVLTPSPLASRPTEISLISPAGNRMDLPVPKAGGLITFPPLMTDSLQVQVVRSARTLNVSPSFGVQLTVPVGLAGISLPDLGIAPVASPHANKNVTLVCGEGPTLLLNGRQVSTSVTGTLGDLLDLKPMRLTACGASGGVKLPAGNNQFQADGSSNNSFSVTSVTIQSSGTPTRVSSTAPRTTQIVKWSSESRSIRVSSGPAAYLVLAQNYSGGWTAKLGSVSLKSVRIDGWQQGYVLPAGASGTVSIVMSPDSLYQKLLIVGAALLILLLLLALIPSRRKLPEPRGPVSLPASWVLFAGGFIVLGLVSGPLAFLLVPAVIIARRWGSGAISAVAFLAFVVAGVAAAWHPAVLDASGADVLGRQAQIASVVALAAVFGALVGEKRTRRRRRGADVEG